ncbi:dihydroneopterin aldolase [Pigmentiphaga sp.]|jgi:dihydroneopterin aldolase|uniref:dihydroneopterin aldolase n=1 Tax=Pigmentiphaga sp. TaxID=1977564 RepID=UPI0025DA32FB|nr:dihydroneopterin aldolase [Pigmentiphaga sp.]MBX6319136.1 dihydroneopterin aldolase [Pigmentiphaga sp.]
MGTRRIFFNRLAVDAQIGILDHERGATQPLHVDAEIDLEGVDKPRHDGIQEVLDYRRLRECIVDECTRTHVNLLETLCDRLASRLLAQFSEIREVRLRVSKPQAFADCAAVGIEVTANRDN